MNYETQHKVEISKKLKERAIYEGFTIAGIASIQRWKDGYQIITMLK